MADGAKSTQCRAPIILSNQNGSYAGIRKFVRVMARRAAYLRGVFDKCTKSRFFALYCTNEDLFAGIRALLRMTMYGPGWGSCLPTLVARYATRMGHPVSYSIWLVGRGWYWFLGADDIGSDREAETEFLKVVFPAGAVFWIVGGEGLG